MKLPAALWGIFAIGAALGLLTANPLLTAVSIMLLPVFMSLLWRPGEPPVLLFAVSFQWLQVTAKVFHANVLGIDVTLLSEYAIGDLPSLERAIWLGIVGLVVLAIGMRVGLWKLGVAEEGRAVQESRHFSTGRAFMLYLVLAAASAVLESLVWNVGGFIQVVRAAAEVKWVGFIILGYLVLRRKEGYPFFFVAVLIEFVAGIGFFSGFKVVLFVTLIVIFTVHHRLKAGAVAAGIVLFASLLILGAGWTSIKPEYRNFLNQGTRAQATLVSQSAQFEKLAELVGELEWDDIAEATGGLFERIAYVDYFALVTEYVPEYTPYEDGELWKRAIQHVLTPRVLFPDKPALIPDSEVTMQYTGLHLASVDQGTSISIGYMGESYVDFGPYGMFVPVFILGVLWGLMYYFFLSRSHLFIIGYAFATTLLLNAYQFEMTGIKLFGGVIGKFLVLALIMYFAERHIAAWLQKGASRERAPRGTFAHEGG